jgi:hypothetical protein
MSVHNECAIEEILCEVFEQTAFLCCEPCPKELLPEPASCLEVRIFLTGDLFGFVCLTMSENVAQKIAASMLGRSFEDNLSRICREDAVKELTNVLCGFLRKKLTPLETDLHPTIPVLTYLSTREWTDRIGGRNWRGFLVEDLPVLFNFRLEGEPQ